MTGFNYHTIQKYAYRENWSVEHLPNYAHIEFFHDHRQIGSYRRRYGSGEEIYYWTQYMTTLRKKPSAQMATSVSATVFWNWPKRMVGPMWIASVSAIT